MAEELTTFVAALVIATGGPVALNVVNVLSLPYLAPLLLVATIRKWYVVPAVKLPMLALTLWYVFPVLLWGAVVSP
jgi:hypothetical protein